MRILLVQPKLDRRVISLGKMEPLSLEILAAALPEHDVRIFDYRFEADLTRELGSFRPEVVGVTGITVEYRTALDAIREVRAFSRDIRVVVGGTHATVSPQSFNRPEVDAIVVGLGHRTFRELLACYESHGTPHEIPGLAFPNAGGLRFSPSRLPEESFGSIPTPNRKLTAKYHRHYRPTFYNVNVGVAISSLGCPARCSFCSSWQQNQGRYLERDAEATVADILSVPEREVLLADDNSLHNIERAWTMARLLQEAGSPKSIVCYARADTIAKNPELMQALREAGLKAVIVGFEAANDQRLKAFNKGSVLATSRAAIQVLRETGIGNYAQFVLAQDFGREDFDELFAFIDAEGLWDPLVTVLTPMPGTQLYKKTRERLVTGDVAHYDFTHCVLPTEKLGYMEFFEEYKRLFLRIYSLRRYARDLWRDLQVRLSTGSWPKTELRHTPFWKVLGSQLLLRGMCWQLRRDYESVADCLPARVSAALPGEGAAPPEDGKRDRNLAAVSADTP